MSLGIESYVPKGWKATTFDALKAPGKYTFVGGPFGSSLTSRDYIEKPGVPVIRGVNLDGKRSRFLDYGFAYVSTEKADELARNLAFPGDMVFTQRGTLGQVAIIPDDASAERYVVSQSQMKLTVDSRKAHPRYLYYWYRSPLAAAYLSQRVLATGVPHINLGILKDFPVLLPTLDEQRRIAAVLDKADAIRRKRREAIALTEELLRSTFLEMFGDPVTNPKGWPTVLLGSVLDRIDSGWSPSCESRPPTEGEWGVLKLGAVTWGRYVATEAKALPPELSPRPEKQVRTGDLLFARKNTYELVGAAALVFETPDQLMMPDLIFRLVPKDPDAAIPPFLWQLINHPGFRERSVRALASGTSGSMPNISKGRLLKMSIPLPPVALRKRWTGVVKAHESLRRKADATRKSADDLFHSLVQRAFRGDL